MLLTYIVPTTQNTRNRFNIEASHVCEGVASRHIHLARGAASTHLCLTTAALPQIPEKRQPSPFQPRHLCIWTQQRATPTRNANASRPQNPPQRDTLRLFGGRQGWEGTRSAMHVHSMYGSGTARRHRPVAEAPLMNLACVNAIPDPDHITSTRGDNLPFASHRERERRKGDTRLKPPTLWRQIYRCRLAAHISGTLGRELLWESWRG